MNKKVLVFEFITGGGYSGQCIAESLAQEGFLMLNALVNDLAVISDIEITVLLAEQFRHVCLPSHTHIIFMQSDVDIWQQWQQQIKQVDAVFPIAPDMTGCLQPLTDLIESEGKQLFNSMSQAVAICSDKLQTAQVLRQHKLNVIDTQLVRDFSGDMNQRWVIKPRESVDCLDMFLVSGAADFKRLGDRIENDVIQPYIEGKPVSLSCVFKQGEAWLICVNEQHIQINQGQFRLMACKVNISTSYKIRYQQFINQVAQVIPSLWGYVGIDMIQPIDTEAVILEINPRLTRSYAGIAQVLPYNIAQTILELDNKPPHFDCPLGMKQVIV